MWHRYFAAGALLGGLTLLAAGCGASSAAAATQKESQKLVLYSAQGYDAAEAAAFQRATGIKVELSDMSTGPLLAKVAAEKTNPRWDVIWFDGNGPMASMAASGQLLTGYSPPNLSHYNSLGRSLLPVNHAYFPTGVTAAGAIIYNTKLVPPRQAPKTWSDLLRPAFRGAVGMNNPAISGPTYPFIAGFFKEYGVANGEKFFTSLHNNGLKIYATNGATLQALLDGTIKAAIFQDSAELGAKLAKDPVQVVYPPSGVTMLPSDVAINAKAPDMQAAKEFVNFVLGQKGQKTMQDIQAAGSDSLFQPVTNEVKPLVSRNGVKWIFLNPVWAGEHESAWVTWFENNVVR
ncbi:ABC transporter substrate-binding protein [Sulfobacillus thermosulfidooxidans]|uniref:ABC transporter substrate-binding protein n=1 Tax=Sulfobacillus thermosulfidooxidans TaxID=28034 RepID=UPI0006B5560F|nr:extracellular solute-binding protein [Sulfobacillus thermosulfidooxidans]